MVLILEYLDSKEIAHRDLKPDNFLLDSLMHLKLTDFGSAKKVVISPKENFAKNSLKKPRIRRGTFVGTRE